MATYNKFNSFVEDILNKDIDLIGSPPGDTLKIGLTNTSPNAADVRVDTTVSPDQIQATSNANEIAAGNGYTEGGGSLTGVTGTRSSGTVTVAANEFTWTAAGGTIGPFQYVYLYDNTAKTTATRPVIAWWNYGAALTLNDGETFTVRFNSASPGTIFTLA